ncbi:DNA repair exonuclease [Suipraeoptans intestinalis]|uniref:metallophosphoesterase family protein n=1 Tax=Suipraeoptans intestinalis TaxID=2606628 RepID=UPI002A74ADE4|nr:DNA repair exonuclease [Suipraeoptans intestinalis]MDY3121248.1 DNA repair exonuclease [Suipraeoptans intestinalis]
MHIADVHLGAKPEAGKAYSDKRPGELWKSLERIIRICNREEIDLLLIAGDLFHRQPLKKELREVNAMFADLQKTQVVLIAGNHDHMTYRSCYADFPWEKQVHFLGRGQEMEWVEFPQLQTAVYGKSYHSREIREPLDAADWRRRHLQPREILLLHGGDETHLPFRKEDLLRLGYDYVALGHIHKPGILAEGRAAYAGALEPTDRSDTGDHGYLLGEWKETGGTLRFVKSAGRKYIPLSVETTERDTAYEIRQRIEAAVRKMGTEHLYKIRLQGRRSPDLLLEQEEMDIFGNLVEWVDDTRPAYDLERLKQRNKDNLLGQMIGEMEEAPEESRHYRALCRGIQALLETGRSL